MGLFSQLGIRKPRIFVQIASYRDPECQWTVKDLFEQATYPERIFVGIMWQYDKKTDKDCFIEPSPRPKQTREIHVKASESQGVCWARHYAQTLYKDEDYVLMIDSHMRFVKGWDEELIAELARCPSPKPLLTHYPPSYQPPRELAPKPKLSVMVPKPFDKASGNIRGDGIVLESTPDAPLRGAFIAAGFVFAKASLIIEVPQDPYLYFNQEEITFAVRLFTKGWDVYHPTKIFVYHLYKKAGDKTQQKLLHWSNDKQWQAIEKRGRDRFHHLVGHKIGTDLEVTQEMEHYGLGKKRSLAQFEAFTGIDFKTLTTSTRTTKGEFIADLEKWKNPPLPPTLPPAPTPASLRAYISNAIKTAPATNATASAPAPAVSQPNYPKLSPLNVGDLLPPFMLPDHKGVEREIQLYAGKKLVLFFLPLDFPAYLDDFFKFYETKRNALEKSDWHRLFVGYCKPDEAARLHEKYKMDRGILCDADGALHRAFGLGRRARMESLSVLVNAGQKILAIYRDPNAINQLADAVRGIEAQSGPAPQPYVNRHLHPPVLIVPDVIPSKMREELLAYWRTGKQYKGTIGVGKETRVSSGKRRVDVDINDQPLLQRIDDQLGKALLPELRKVSAFEAIYRDRYKIGHYSQNDAGYYNQHRDTGIKDLAHRRYSMSIPLNDAYEGGMLHFPEYGPVHYKVNGGSAILFPSALLHGVTPVTSGERFVMVSFFHGPLEEAYRKRLTIERGQNYNDNSWRMMIDPNFTELKQSDAFYTSSIVTRVMDE